MCYSGLKLRIAMVVGEVSDEKAVLAYTSGGKSERCGVW